MSGTETIWNADATAILTERWLAGDGFGQIADQIPGATASTVRDKRRRLKLPQRPAARGFPIETNEAIIAAIEAGESNNKIAARMRVDFPRIAALRKTCVDAPIIKTGRPAKEITDEMRAGIIAGITAGVGAKRLGLQFGISEQRVLEIRRLEGIQTPPGVQPKPISPEIRARILEMLDAGHPIQSVARALCIADYKVREVRDGLPPKEWLPPAPAPIAQTVFDLVVIPRPAPVPVMPAWRSMPIPRSKECVWVEPGERKRQWIYCDAPTLKGRSYCKCHDDMAYVRGSAE